MSISYYSKMGKRISSRTDWTRFDAMRDEDIVYDEDTSAPFSDTDLENIDGFVANGIEDMRHKMKELPIKQKSRK